MNHQALFSAARSFCLGCAACCLVLISSPQAGAAQAKVRTEWKFACGAAPAPAGFQQMAASVYSAGSGYGFDLATGARVERSSCADDRPYFFSVAVPEGNYRVTVTLGSDAAASVTTVKAEARRLMLMEVPVARGGAVTHAFVVNIRTPRISASEQVRLKPREVGNLDWDHKLTLEFNGTRPSVRRILIRKVNVPTVYLAGDSTVVDQDKEPWAAWGQMLPCFFGPGIAIANDAESGETIRSFVGENRLDKIAATLKKGDYLFIQFAHNDQKPGPGYVPAWTEYQKYLRRHIADARKVGAHPVLVTSMNRRSFDAQGKIVQTLGDYPAAMRQVAKQEGVPLIDLNAMSKTLFETLGPERTLKVFVHFPPNTFPGQMKALADNTHFTDYGAYELARSVVQDIRDDKLPLVKYLTKDAGSFNPAYPDPLDTWSLPLSPMVSAATPYAR